MGFGDFFSGALKAAAPILGATNPWLGVGAGLLGGALGGGGGGSEDVAGLASQAPTQTPDQAELSAFAKPYMKGWMQSPPKVTGGPYQNTRVTIGGPKVSYVPSSIKQFMPVAKPAPAPTQPTAPAPTQGGTGAIFGSGPKWQWDPIGRAYVPQIDGNGGITIDQIPENANMATQAKNVGSFGGGQQVYPKNQFLMLNPQYGGGSVAAAATGASPTGTGAGNGETTPTDFGFPSPGRQFEITPGTVNIPGVPDPQMTTGMFGSYQGLSPDAQFVRDTAKGNINRSLPEGYTADYLNNLAAGQMDPLKEAFDLALSRSNSDWNNRGLRASTFPGSEQFGAQPDSVSSRFIKEAGNVARDVNLRGQEAAREDRFRNADLQDRSLDFLQGNIQGDEANRQWWSTFGQGQKEFDINQINNNWQQQANLGQYLTGREDSLLNKNTDLDMGLQTQNIGFQQDALKDILSYIYGLQPQANAANQNWWNASKVADANQQQRLTDEQDTINWLTSLFTKKDTPAPIPPSSTGPIIPNFQLKSSNPSYSQNWRS